MDTSLLFAGVIFGSIGTAYFVYGKKQQNWIAFVCGIILCVTPYFIANIYLLVATGIVLGVLPFLIKL
ncbi:MAG: amino acid transport protein [Candidatus Omnitrophota bacterium]|nr:amino acid transport protein [Candidatus Omnitrophota bacterium]